MTLTEDQKAEAARRLHKAAVAAKTANAELEAAAVAAKEAGVPVTRIAEIAETNRDRVYSWLRKTSEDPAAQPD